MDLKRKKRKKSKAAIRIRRTKWQPEEKNKMIIKTESLKE